jgi:hypothetical protein
MAFSLAFLQDVDDDPLANRSIVWLNDFFDLRPGGQTLFFPMISADSAVISSGLLLSGMLRCNIWLVWFNSTERSPAQNVAAMGIYFRIGRR